MIDRDGRGDWTKTRIGTGNQEASTSKGSSEVKVGRLRAARPTSPQSSPGTVTRSWSILPAKWRRRGLWSRHVIAEPLQWGHAVWCADLDGDGDDELIIGQRDANSPARRVRAARRVCL